MNKKLTKSSTDRALTGVCGGIAEHFGIPSLAVRLIFIFIPSNLIIYIILAITLPDNYPSL
ncbi:PspC domain-containing protein [Ornithinibacillus sp. FSL M8-0202]|uniref:PspC domain-containing protein n=1 Tax=Ornithinibacillus sp. FSL M8-0202 TaxID=2921616 RepID=UPI0030CBB621